MFRKISLYIFFQVHDQKFVPYIYVYFFFFSYILGSNHKYSAEVFLILKSLVDCEKNFVYSVISGK